VAGERDRAFEFARGRRAGGTLAAEAVLAQPVR
jgi:hypothetical protein